MQANSLKREEEQMEFDFVMCLEGEEDLIRTDNEKLSQEKNMEISYE